MAATTAHGQPAETAPASGAVLIAPSGTEAVFRRRKSEVKVQAPLAKAGSSTPYGRTGFSPPPGSEPLEWARRPAGQTCVMYGAADSGPVKAGCEWTFDHLVRVSGDAGTYYDSNVPVIGGADRPVGRTRVIYGEGRFVAFLSSAKLAGANGQTRQIFWRDRLTGTTHLVSASASGAEGNANSHAPSISADGLTVVFQSEASNLVPGDTNDAPDVFVWTAPGAVAALGVRRVSVGPGGRQADGASTSPVVSGDGQFVAFVTSAGNLVTGIDASTDGHVVLADLVAGSLTAISRGQSAATPAISEDGSRIAFCSFSDTLVPGDTNGLWDIFLWQRGTALRRLSLTEKGGERDQGEESSSRLVSPSISGDGRFVAFATTATNVVAGDTNGKQDVFIVAVDSGQVRRTSVGKGGVQGNGDSPADQVGAVALSYDGSWLAFSTTATNLGATAQGANMLLRNVQTGETRVLTNTTFGVGRPAISVNGAYVVFGAADGLDRRFAGKTGLFAYFTGVSRALAWTD